MRWIHLLIVLLLASFAVIAQDDTTTAPPPDLNPIPEDGLIVFVSERTGNGDIYTMHPDGTNIQQLTFTEEGETFPKFSPDGSMIAYYIQVPATDGFPDTELWVMNRDGTGARQLGTTSSFDIQWSPDSQFIVYNMDDNPEGNRDTSNILAIANVATGQSSLLFNNDVTVSNPFWSAEGNAVYFFTNLDGTDNRILYLISADGMSIETIEHSFPDGAGGDSSNWSADGQQMLTNTLSVMDDGMVISNIGWYDFATQSYTVLFEVPLETEDNHVLFLGLAPNQETFYGYFFDRDGISDPEIILYDPLTNIITELTSNTWADGLPHWINPNFVATNTINDDDRLQVGDVYIYDEQLQNVIATELITLNNCQGNATISRERTFSREEERVISISETSIDEMCNANTSGDSLSATIETGVDIEVFNLSSSITAEDWTEVSSEICSAMQSEFGYSDGQVFSEELTITFELPARERSMYEVQWLVTSVHGEIELIIRENSYWIPFSIPSQMTAEIQAIETEDCE